MVKKIKKQWKRAMMQKNRPNLAKVIITLMTATTTLMTTLLMTAISKTVVTIMVFMEWAWEPVDLETSSMGIMIWKMMMIKARTTTNLAQKYNHHLTCNMILRLIRKKSMNEYRRNTNKYFKDSELFFLMK